MILVNSGQLMNPVNPSYGQIKIEDIAHALSNLCRFGGHVRRFYSVAEHSVRVSYMVSKEHALKGLLHDASEAYMQDVVKPLKDLEFMWKYRNTEDRVLSRILHLFTGESDLPEEVHVADQLACQQEGWLLVPGWKNHFHRPPPASPTSVIACYQPGEAKEIFLRRYQELAP